MSETEFARAERYWRETCRLQSRISELEKRAAWVEDLLQRATGHIAGKERWNEHARQWIEDYAKGPSEGNGGGGNEH